MIVGVVFTVLNLFHLIENLATGGTIDYNSADLTALRTIGAVERIAGLRALLNMSYEEGEKE